jgi:3-oxoacyl-[acyl-carrier protein] reductase
MNLSLTNKVAMVAGASRGLGYAVARGLAEEGVQVSIGSRDAAAIESAGRRIEEETGARVLTVAADVSSAPAIEQWHQKTIERFGGIDLLFTNSGGPPPGSALTFEDAAWQKAFELLLMSAVRMIRLKEPIANLALSNILRASVAALSKTLASELAGQKIRVNHLIPGRIDTDRLKELDEANSKRLGVSLEDQQKKMMQTIPMSRYGDPKEFANAAVFLFSDAASYITGATLQVDGGQMRSV